MFAWGARSKSGSVRQRNSSGEPSPADLYMLGAETSLFWKISVRATQNHLFLRRKYRSGDSVSIVLKH